MKKIKLLLAGAFALLAIPTIAKAAELKVGDYVEMVPTKTSYTVLKEDTGCNADNVLNPSELKLWRIISKDNNGNYEAVSEYTSSKAVCFGGKKGYTSFVKVLKQIAKAYENSTYTVGSRMIGNTEFQSDEVDETFYNEYHIGESNQIRPNYISTDESTEISLGGETVSGLFGDTFYKNDLKLISDVYKSDTTTYGSKGIWAYEIDDSDGYAGAYWVSSRYYNLSTTSSNDTQLNFRGRYVWDDLDALPLYYCIPGLCNETKNGSGPGVRPIIVLKSSVTTASGEGTKSSPYKLAAGSSSSGTTTTKKTTTGATIRVAINNTFDISKRASNASGMKWTSSDTSIATVENGVVTTKKVGKVTITGESDTEKFTNVIYVYKRVKSNDAKNITILVGEKLKDKDFKLKVEELSESSDRYKTLKSKLSNAKKMKIYNIDLVLNNSKIQPDEDVILEFDIPTGYDKTKLAVFRVESDGTLTRLTISLVNGKINAITNHFSEYVVAELNETTNVEESDIKIEEAKTGSGTTENPKTGAIISISLIAILSIAGASIYFYTKKKNVLFRV